jgi:hypothetical protein
MRNPKNSQKERRQTKEKKTAKTTSKHKETILFCFFIFISCLVPKIITMNDFFSIGIGISL